jgi:Uma2 family endonuclease
MNQIVKPLPGTVEDPRYPDSDGRFMGETDFHNVAMIAVREALEDFFADRPDVYVASNIVMYYRHGDPKARKDPDVLFARGVVGKHKRRSFRVWEEKVVPQVLFEIASRRTWRNDLDDKRLLYASIGVREYFVFDPERRFVKPVLQGFRTLKGQSVPIKAKGDGSLTSRELGLALIPEGDLLRLIDRSTGQPVLTRSERAHQLAAEVEQLRARLADLEP